MKHALLHGGDVLALSPDVLKRLIKLIEHGMQRIQFDLLDLQLAFRFVCLALPLLLFTGNPLQVSLELGKGLFFNHSTLVSILCMVS